MSERADAQRVAIRGIRAVVAALLAASSSGCVREPLPPIAAGLGNPQAEAKIARLTQQAVRHL